MKFSSLYLHLGYENALSFFILILMIYSIYCIDVNDYMMLSIFLLIFIFSILFLSFEMGYVHILGIFVLLLQSKEGTNDDWKVCWLNLWILLRGSAIIIFLSMSAG